MAVGDAEDKARYARYHAYIDKAVKYEERAITAATERERRNAAEYARELRARAFALMV